MKRVIICGLLIAGLSVFSPAAKVQAQNSMSVRTGAERVEYNPMVFGAFLEHFDNQVYGGVFCPGSPLADEDGFRKDVMEALRKIRVPIVRWPGGCFVSSCHWADGVGSKRRPTFDKTPVCAYESLTL